ncbi:MAG: hypothetical protein IT480_18085, partial [Gammaproteobacteria bacterium]|nr:hypothetical protein [Gammaproteobacteria bacterium]
MSRALPQHFARHRLTLTAVAVLLVLLLITFAALLRLLTGAAERERSAREKLFERDLHVLEGLFGEDTGYVLDRNLTRFLDPRRPIAPLVLPRAYQVVDPGGTLRALPERPPINCSLALRPAAGAIDRVDRFPDRLCAYFAADPGSRRYLYLTMTFLDPSLAGPRSQGLDPGASAVQLSMHDSSGPASWWLQVEAPSAPPALGGVRRVGLRAFRAGADGQVVPETRASGSVYIERPEPDVQTITIDARIEIADAAAAVWPPPGWEALRIQVERRRIDPLSGAATTLRFDTEGATVWSLPALLASFYDAHADVTIHRRLESGATESWSIGPAGVQPRAAAASQRRVRLAGGDLVIQSRSPRRWLQTIPNTRVVVELAEPGVVIQKGVWQTTLLLFLVLLGFLALAVYVFLRVLRPIGILAMKSRQ